MIQIDILLSEDQIAQEFMDALERHDLPEKFFYWFPLSIRAWINLCGDGAVSYTHLTLPTILRV